MKFVRQRIGNRGNYKGRVPDLQRVCLSLQLNTNQGMYMRKLPKGGKEPPEKNRQHNLGVHIGLKIVLVPIAREGKSHKRQSIVESIQKGLLPW